LFFLCILPKLPENVTQAAFRRPVLLEDREV
jgi:hypothetical protein